MATIAEILKYPKGAAVQDLTATIEKAFPPRKGEGQNGPWSVMDLNLRDDAGDTIKGQWWFHLVDDPDSLSGQRVVINATPDNKGTLRGATVDHHEYQGRTTIRIKVNGERLQFAPAGAPAAVPSGAASVQHQNGRLTLTDYLSATGRAYRYAVDVLGIIEQPAAVAFANTAGIAASQGRLVIDEPEDAPPPF